MFLVHANNKFIMSRPGLGRLATVSIVCEFEGVEKRKPYKTKAK